MKKPETDNVKKNIYPGVQVMRFGSFLVLGLQKKSLWVALIVGLLYMFVSTIWILFSDHLVVRLTSDQQHYQLIQQYKGLGFVGFMTFLIVWLVYKVHHRGVVMENALHHIRTDMVTGLANRIVAEEFITNQLHSLNLSTHSCGIILFNVCRLNRVNISVGRSGGDRLLYEIGQRIKKIARPTDLVARLESDRILVVLGTLVNDKEALALGNKIRQAFNVPVQINDLDVQIELQGVVAIAPGDGRSAFELLDACERGLYRSKVRKKEPHIELVSKEDLASNAGYLELEAELRRAIRERKFTIAMQPQIKLDTFELVGAEALIRWYSTERGNISPAEFIPLAESLGLITEITGQVLDQVGCCIAVWLERGLPEVRVSINLSGLDLKSGRILELVGSFLSHYRIPGHLITLEITESWLMEDPNLALGLIHQLRDMGPRLAIDDFGTGYSALSQLIDFPFDYVKFDRPFVSGINHSPQKTKVLAAIQRMSSTLGAQTIAEGVETIRELAVIEDLGINEVQGYLFSKPVSLSEFEACYLNPKQPAFRDIREKLKKLKADNPNLAIRIRRATTP